MSHTLPEWVTDFFRVGNLQDRAKAARKRQQVAANELRSEIEREKDDGVDHLNTEIELIQTAARGKQ